MSDKPLQQDSTVEQAPRKEGLSRREFVARTGATGAAVAAGTGLGLFGGKAPAYAQSRTMHILDWSSFITEADHLVDAQAEEFGKMEGIKVNVEHIHNNQLNARATAAVESGSGPDIIQIFNNMPQLFADGFIDHSDLVAEAGGDEIYPIFRDATLNKGRYVGCPYFATASAFVYRRDIFREAGAAPPTSWEDFLVQGKKIKDLGYPVGQALGHSYGDPPSFAYQMLWSFGGYQVDENNRVAIVSPETRRALEFIKEFWTTACDESGLSWDDGSNNRAFFAQTIGTTLNGASIYFVAKRNWDEKQDPFLWKLFHFLSPQGSAGNFQTVTAYARCIFKHSKVQTAAKNYIRYTLQQNHYKKFLDVNGGYANAITPKREDWYHWEADPALMPYKNICQYAVPHSYKGDYDRRASEVLAKYIIVDMFARAVQGDSPDAAMKWAESELKQVYRS